MDETQRQVCDRYGMKPCPPSHGSHVGIALRTLAFQPLNGMRILPQGEACGWFLWGGGDPSDADDFYQPLCVEHLADRCPAAIPFLALPPGWRFFADGQHIDVWYDEALITG